MATIAAEFDREKFLSLHPHMSDDLPAHIRGAAYWVEFGDENQSVCHVQDSEGNKYPVEFINNQWYQLTWGASGYQTSNSSKIIPEIRVNLGLGWYEPQDLRYQQLFLSEQLAKSSAKGKERTQSTDLHSPHSPPDDKESKDDLPLGIQVKESPVDDSPVEAPGHIATPMPGEWKTNLGERIQAAQLKHIIKISDKGIDKPLPDPGLFPEASAIVLLEAVKNFEDVPPAKSPLLTPAAISALSRAAHIFQPQATFQPTFGQPSLPAMIGATTTWTQTRPQSTAARYTVHGHGGGGLGGSGPSGSGGGGGSPGSGGSGLEGGGGSGPPRVGPAGSGATGGDGGSNGGMKGNPPTIFASNRFKSDDFLWEFKIYRVTISLYLAYCTNMTLIGLLDC